jgi:enoyl-CoA hydratase
MTMSSEALKADRAGTVLRLTLNRPQARNALNIDLTRALAAALGEFDVDNSLRVLVITGTDPAFCAGLDLKSFADPASPRSEVGALLTDVPRRAKPVIGAINGAAMTGGLELALGCDFLIASDRARFGDTHTKIGALAGGGMNSRLPHAVGYRWAKQLSFTCDPIDAATALRIGLVNEVVPHDQLLTRSMALAESIARHDPMLLVTVKQILERGSLSTLADNIFLEREALAARKARSEVRWKT